MFGTNEIIGQNYFKNLQDTLLITSVFYTLQGEGPFSGQPSVFVRLTKCNLDCSFCDTFFDKGDELTYEQIMKKIEACILEFHEGTETPVEDIMCETILVITGGEPMLQKNLADFLHEYGSYFKDVQTESNGIIYQKDIPVTVLQVVSPKCSEKINKYIKPKKEVLERANVLKFVLSADPSSPYNSIPDWAFELKKERKNLEIYCSPMNIYNDIPLEAKKARLNNTELSIEERSRVDEVVSFWEPNLLNMKENQKNHEYAARYCMKHGCILSLQTHLLASLA